MSEYARVSRLRALISELERAAPSEQRDAVLGRARDRLRAVELAWQQPSAWPLRGQRRKLPPARWRARPENVEPQDFALD